MCVFEWQYECELYIMKIQCFYIFSEKESRKKRYTSIFHIIVSLCFFLYLLFSKRIKCSHLVTLIARNPIATVRVSRKQATETKIGMCKVTERCNVTVVRYSADHSEFFRRGVSSTWTSTTSLKLRFCLFQKVQPGIEYQSRAL